METHQGHGSLNPLLRSKTQIHNLIRHNHVSGNSKELIVGIKLRISKSITHPKHLIALILADF